MVASVSTKGSNRESDRSSHGRGDQVRLSVNLEMAEMNESTTQLE